MKPLVLVIWWWWWGTIEMQIFAMMKEIWQLISAKKNTLTIPGHGPAGNVWCVIFRSITLLGRTIAFCPPSHNIHHSSQINFHHWIQGNKISFLWIALHRGGACAAQQKMPRSSGPTFRLQIGTFRPRDPFVSSNWMDFDALPSSERDGCFWCWRFGALCFLFLVQKVKGSWSQFTTVEKSFPSSDFKEANILTSVIVTFVFYIYDHTTK